MKIKITYQTL